MILPVISVSAQTEKNDGIIILYENDVHCAIDGYAKLSTMKTEFSESFKNVGVVAVGDFVQGSSLGSISQGEYIVNIMNLVGYDAITLGNHEFDYKIPRLFELVSMMDTKPVCSNFQKIGETETVFEPYSIVSYEEVDIAYVGITTPDMLISSSPTQFFDENGNRIIRNAETNLGDFCADAFREVTGADIGFMNVALISMREILHLMIFLSGAPFNNRACVVEVCGQAIVDMLDAELLEVYITENLDGVVGEEYAISQNGINIIDGEDKKPETGESIGALIILINVSLLGVITIKKIKIR